MSKIAQQINQVFMNAIKNKKSISYYLERCYHKDNLLIYDNKEDGMMFFRELYVFYSQNCSPNIKYYKDYTLCFWNDGKQCFRGIYNKRSKRILNSALIENNDIIYSLPPHTYTI